VGSPRDADFRSDWVLTHEMLHFAFPDLTTDDSWAEEGLATYVEPLARLRVGTMTEERMWRDLVTNLPRGQPRAGDGGLHATRAWGRTYGGGALYWFLADVEIHERSGNACGLADALRAILEAGGDIRAEWPLARALETADRALGQTTLQDLYRRLGERPEAVDLEAVWRTLGVRARAGGIVYDDAAPLAGVRRAIARRGTWDGGATGGRCGRSTRRP
jgi:predicted metalloprotease with PDZ domain